LPKAIRRGQAGDVERASLFVDSNRPPEERIQTLDRAAAAPFSPAESLAWYRAQRSLKRKTPQNCGNHPGTNRQKKPKRRPRDYFTRCSYGRAIADACERLWPTPPELSGEERQRWRRENHWSPNRLRHNAATQLRSQFDADVARTVLGQRSLAATEVYAEQEMNKAESAMRLVG